MISFRNSSWKTSFGVIQSGRQQVGYKEALVPEKGGKTVINSHSLRSGARVVCLRFHLAVGDLGFIWRLE